MGEAERNLTHAELRRKAIFEKACKELEQKGYEYHDLTISVVKANVLGTAIMLPFVAVSFWMYYAATESTNKYVITLGENLFLIIAMIGCFVLHELIHGLVWGMFAKNHFHSIEFGFIVKMLTPYCTCAEALKKWQYILGGIMPTLILGFGLAGVSIFVEKFWVLLLAVAMIWGGGGDFLIILKILLYKSKGRDALYYDHPFECGLVVFEK